MADDFLNKEEAVQHTAEAGGSAKSRVEELLESLGNTLAGVAENTSKMAEHLASLQIQKAAEDVPHTAREGVNDTVDTAGAAGDVGAKAIDVPLAASEDVIHDTAETVNAANKDVVKAKKMFGKRRK